MVAYPHYISTFHRAGSMYIEYFILVIKLLDCRKNVIFLSVSRFSCRICNYRTMLHYNSRIFYETRIGIFFERLEYKHIKSKFFQCLNIFFVLFQRIFINGFTLCKIIGYTVQHCSARLSNYRLCKFSVCHISFLLI